MNVIKLKHLLGVLIGAAVGYGLTYAFRCAGGTCPLSHNPWIGISFGAVAGLIVAWDASPSKKTSGKEKSSI